MIRPVVIGIDGPAGAGKSTVGKRLADRLGYFYFDTGVLYRAAALQALAKGVDPRDEPGLARLVAELDVRVQPASVEDGRQSDVLLDGVDVSGAIRSPAVDAIVSPVAASAAVRAGLIEAQRQQVRPPGTVIVGRDIGTVVCPDADVKVFLEASAEERARRRLRQAGESAPGFAAVLAGIAERDRLDSTRSLAPLARAEDATVVQTDGLSVEQVVERIRSLLDGRRPRG